MQANYFVALVAAITAYHHAIYPAILEHIARRRGAREPDSRNPNPLPTFGIMIPAQNEAACIALKVANLAAIDYPRDRMRIFIACDGCTDATASLARAALREHGLYAVAKVVELQENVGKVATLNAVVPMIDCDVLAFSDASAMLEADCLRRAMVHFSDPDVGVVCPTYRLAEAAGPGEAAYWAYQARIKAGEGAIGAPIGAHGAFYMIRRSFWSALPADTINDDVIIPMRIVAAGHRAVYDVTTASTETEATNAEQEWRRRVRIGAGNIQQVMRLAALANPCRPGVAFAFISGKALRAAIPFLAIAAQIAIFASALGGDVLMCGILSAQALLAAFVLVAHSLSDQRLVRFAEAVKYAAKGYAASLVGMIGYIVGCHRSPWHREAVVTRGFAVAPAAEGSKGYMPIAVQLGKRAIDIACALVALIVLVVVFAPIALAIKLESRGPIFYRQLRVGRITPLATHMFYLIKFRSMRMDAEKRTGAVWATKDDPRITRIGRFLRKSRLDELPQCINVLKGEMSVVGPRPERPGFFNKLEGAIPYYTERTYGVRPGITGLAQVNQAYDSCIEDVRNKVLYDHAYAAQLTSWRRWFATDLEVIFKTFFVMALGKGQ